MAIYELRQDSIRLVPETNFKDENIRERYDLQRLLRDRIEIIDPHLMVIAEEFGNWEDSRRRIDLLALDKDANLVVVELKRTKDGGFMELQAVRYAAMISTMTFDQVVDTYQDYLARRNVDQDARQCILDFLEWDEPKEDQFARNVRIVLVSAEFSRELTTTVLWLNQQGLDIRCVRLKPYTLDGKVIIDDQQVIPLPEAEEYQVRVREKDQRQRAARASEMSMPEVWEELNRNCSKEVVSTARDIEAWLHDKADEVFPLSHGFAQVVRARGNNYYFFKVTTDGRVQVWFQYLSRKPPFSDVSLRQELRQMLCAIPGVTIDESKITGKPSFHLHLLTSKKAMDMFIETMEWAFEKVLSEK
ncbi:MAG TPA: hypothetical protein PLS81_11655 [Deltaproteobacteria bacterium]|nr:hypothetical protein [Deltaproteobacteria bacterium]HPP81209.1 hypothetical protein [Deltaproteobacteria bacterium]